MHVTNLLLLAGALGASAHPSHGHAHREAHDKRANDVHYKAIHKTITTTVTPVATTTSTTTPVVVAPATSTSTSAAAAATSSSSSSSSGSGSGAYVPFCGGATKREVVETTEKKRTTLAEIAYVGNTGTASDWGCNMQTVASDIATLYNYTAAFTNVASEPYAVACFNKIGPTGQIDGPWHTAVSFTVAPGATQYVAFEGNSQGSCAFGPGSVPTTPAGQLSGTWAEFDFENSSNGGWSGADCSSLVAQANSQTVYGCRACNEANTCSTILPGGAGTNAYTAGLEDASGLGINQTPGSWVLKVDMGYSG